MISSMIDEFLGGVRRVGSCHAGVTEVGSFAGGTGWWEGAVALKDLPRSVRRNAVCHPISVRSKWLAVAPPKS